MLEGRKRRGLHHAARRVASASARISAPRQTRLIPAILGRALQPSARPFDPRVALASPKKDGPAFELVGDRRLASSHSVLRKKYASRGNAWQEPCQAREEAPFEDASVCRMQLQKS